jgi:hypothetical protein
MKAMSGAECRSPSEASMGNGTLSDAHFSRLQRAPIALIRSGTLIPPILRAISLMQEVAMSDRAKSVALPETA